MNFETIVEEKNETIKTFILCFTGRKKLVNKALKLETIRVFERKQKPTNHISGLTSELEQYD